MPFIGTSDPPRITGHSTVPFSVFARASVYEETTLSCSTHNHMFEKYWEVIRLGLTGKSTVRHLQYRWYIAFKYINRYQECTRSAHGDNCKDVLTTAWRPTANQNGDGCTIDYVNKYCMPMLRDLETKWDEFEFGRWAFNKKAPLTCILNRWCTYTSRRLEMMNHVPHLPRSFTCVVDSTPIKIWNSGDSAVDHRTYSGKDRYHCLNPFPT